MHYVKLKETSSLTFIKKLKHALHISTMAVNNTDNKDDYQIPAKISENTNTCSTNATQKRKERRKPSQSSASLISTPMSASSTFIESPKTTNESVFDNLDDDEKQYKEAIEMSKIHAMSEFEQLKHALHISTMAVNNTDTANTLHPKNLT